MGEHSLRPVVSPWVNPITRALRDGKVCIGFCTLSFPCPALAQISGQAGFNFLYVDLEHSGLSIQAIEPICTPSKLAGITPIVGTSGIADFLISRVLDNGAMGVIVPHVNTREEANLVVNACRYAPVGSRGFVNFGAHTRFEIVDPVKCEETMNQEILVAVKVESAQAIENIEEIAATPGLNAVLVGPGDLSVSLGIPGQFRHPRLFDAIERVLAACQRNGIASGPHVTSIQTLREWVDRGATFLSLGIDGIILLEASRQFVQEARNFLGDQLL